jgi:hypothetical protein
MEICMVKFQLTLDENEAKALSRWAAAEMRDPRDQIRFIVRQALERQGYLPAESAGESAEGISQQTQPDFPPDLLAVFDRLAAIGRQRREAARAAGQEIPIDPATAELAKEVIRRLESERAEHANTK